MSIQSYSRNRRRGKRLSPATLCTLALIVAYILLFSQVTVGRHWAIGTHTYDLVNMDQAVWNTLRGRWLEFSTVPGVSTRLAYHFEPILFPISLLYLIHDGAETLLVLQTVVIALGALPVYWLARDRFHNAWTGALFAALYLLYPPIEAANNFDFHAVALASPLLLFAIHAIQSEHRWQAVFFSILAMGCKENIPLLVAMLGVYVLIFHKDKKLGLLLFGLGIVWFLIAFQVIMPHFAPGGGNPYVARYRQWGDSKREILITLLTDPRKVWSYLTKPFKLVYFRNLLFPFAFMPLLAPQWLLLSAPSLAINLLSGEYAQSLADDYHYAASIVPFVVTASICGGSWLVQTLSSRLKLNRSWVLTGFIVVISTTSLFQHYYRGFTPLAYTFAWPKQTDHHRIGMEIMSRIPLDAAVSAQSDLGPHLSHRRKYYLFPRIDDAEYVMLDVTSTIFPIKSYGDYKKTIGKLLSAGFGILESKDGYLLLKRGLNNHKLDPDFYSFALRDEDVQPQHRIEASFESGLRLTGYDLEQHRNSVVRLITYWQLKEPTEESLEIQIYTTDADGEILNKYKPQTTYWFPPQEWPAESVIAVDSGTLNLWKVPEVHLAVGVVARAGTSDAHRLGARIISSPMGPPLVQGSTLVRLTGLCYKNTVLLDCSQRRSFSVPSSAKRIHYVLGDRIALVGYELDAQAVWPGDSLHLTLCWQSLASTDADYTVFTQLTELQPRMIWGQEDKPPWQGRYPTSWWVPGEVVTDRYTIEVKKSTPPGKYILQTGMYLLSTGERLLVVGDAGAAGDRIVLTEIEVLPTD